MELKLEDVIAYRNALEPLTRSATGDDIELASIAISLRRIADAMTQGTLVIDPPKVPANDVKRCIYPDCDCGEPCPADRETEAG